MYLRRTSNAGNMVSSLTFNDLDDAKSLLDAKGKGLVWLVPRDYLAPVNVQGPRISVVIIGYL